MAVVIQCPVTPNVCLNVQIMWKQGFVDHVLCIMKNPTMTRRIIKFLSLLGILSLSTGYDVELTNGQHVSIGAGHLAKYYGRGYLTVGPGSLSSSSSSSSPSCSQFAGYSTTYQSQVPHHHQQVHTPSSPSPSTPTGTYSTSHPSFNYVTPSSPRQTMCPMSYQYGLFQYPSRTSTPQYTCSQSSAHMPFMRGMMEIKKQIAAGSCKPPQAATKQQQRQKIVNTYIEESRFWKDIEIVRIGKTSDTWFAEGLKV